MCSHTGWPAGHAWLLAEDGSGQLVSSHLWHLDDREAFRTFREATEAMRFSRGEGLPGRVLGTGQPAWMTSSTMRSATIDARFEPRSASPRPRADGVEACGDAGTQ